MLLGSGISLKKKIVKKVAGKMNCIINELRCKEILRRVANRRILVIGDLILDHFVWGRVRRISPEAPVPVVEFAGEAFMPGGAANVARNITSLGGSASIVGVVGNDIAGRRLRTALTEESVGVNYLVTSEERQTSCKMRIIARHQQITRLDRENSGKFDDRTNGMLFSQFEEALQHCDAVIIGDYGKGVVTNLLLKRVREYCRRRKIWLSLDPKPTSSIDLRGLSLLTPNRREAFALAGVEDFRHCDVPKTDKRLQTVARKLLSSLKPKVLLITLSEQGMLLCRTGFSPIHIPTVARQVFDVSGAGDTVIATYTLAIASGANPEEASIIANYAAGVVVGKAGTAVVTPDELLKCLREG